MTSPRLDQTRCPLCAGDNACGAARGAGTCWCYAYRIPEDVLARVPADERDRVCICERCATGGRTPAVRQNPDTGGGAGEDRVRQGSNGR